jgi:DNA-binding CsgD family transcriptional regulator
VCSSDALEVASNPGSASDQGRAVAVGLTTTETAVLMLLSEGHTAYSIGLRLEMSPRTASKHLEHIYRKLHVSDRLAAVRVAQQLGIVAPPILPGQPRGVLERGGQRG